MTLHRTLSALSLLLCVSTTGVPLHAQEPVVRVADAAPRPQIAYQGRLLEGGWPVTGVRTFRFALLDGAGTELWTSEAVDVSVNSGLYALILGGAGQPAIPDDLLSRAALKVRVFVNGSALSPDVDLVAAFQARSAFAFSGPLAGDVTGTQEDTRVTRLLGLPLDFTAPPAAGQALVFNGASWVPSAAAGPAGPAGATGPQGPAGPMGLMGPMGPKGDTGAAGPAGPAGMVGPVGPSVYAWKGPFAPAAAYVPNDVVSHLGASYVALAASTGSVPPSADWALIAQKGDVGPAGPVGATGPEGPTGPKGDSGAAGPVGATGPQGPVGPMGPQGPSGLAAGSAAGVTPYWNGTQWVLNSSNLFNNGARIGMGGVINPRASLEVGGLDGLVITGEANQGTAQALGAGSRLQWSPRRGAFRVGRAEGDWWDDNGTSTPKLALYSIAMGYQPRASGVASTAIGAYNKATGDYALALGSYSLASASHSIAIGTQVTASGIYSIALGSGADTNGMDGALVIGDDTYFQTTYAPNDNSFIARFCGTNAGSVAYKFYTGYPQETSPNVYMLRGDNAWRSSCSRDLKENFAPVDDAWLLGRIRNLPITRWNYKVDDPSVQYIGPMSEDFWDAFHLAGTDNKGINAFALQGVTLAAVKALEDRTARQQQELEALKEENRSLKARLDRLEAALGAR